MSSRRRPGRAGDSGRSLFGLLLQGPAGEGGAHHRSPPSAASAMSSKAAEEMGMPMSGDLGGGRPQGSLPASQRGRGSRSRRSCPPGPPPYRRGRGSRWRQGSPPGLRRLGGGGALAHGRALRRGLRRLGGGGALAHGRALRRSLRPSRRGQGSLPRALYSGGVGRGQGEPIGGQAVVCGVGGAHQYDLVPGAVGVLGFQGGTDELAVPL